MRIKTFLLLWLVLSAMASTSREFLTQQITVRGNRVTVRVQDVVTVDYTEAPAYSHPKFRDRDVDHGTFALQAHDPNSTVYYRDIWVRTLD